MSERIDIEELQAYRRKIFDGTNKKLHECILELNDVVSMLGDFQEINTALFDVVDELSRQNEGLQDELQRKNTYIEKTERRNAEYDELEADAVKVASIRLSLEKKSASLNIQMRQFENEREEFEKVKSVLEEKWRDTNERADKLKKERDDANLSRDRAIAEKRELEYTGEKYADEVKKLKKEKETYKNKVHELDITRKWYKNYAEAVDEKIIKYYENHKEELDKHYYDYLNNTEKWDEHRLYFPDFQKNEGKSLPEKRDITYQVVPKEED